MKRKTKNLMKVIWIVLSIFAAVKMLFFAYGLDEEYQLVMSYRNVAGDSLFLNMWEPHQSSAFLNVALMKPFLLLTGGSTTGIVLYLRACGTVIHLAVSLFLYHVLTNFIQKEYCFYLALIYFNTIPKQIMMPEFGIMQVWFFTLILLFWICYYCLNQKKIWLVLAGFMMVLEVLSYPSCLILYPFMCYVIWKHSRERWKDLGIFTGICAACGVLYLLRLLRHNTIEGFLQTASYIVNGDITHSLTFGGKLLSAIMNMGYLGALLLLAFVITLVIYMLFEKTNKVSKEQRTAFMTAGIMICACFIEVFYWVVLNKGYETMQIHLVAAAVLGSCYYLKNRKIQKAQKEQSAQNNQIERFHALLWDGILGSGVSLLAVLYLTDLTLIESLPHAMLASFFGMVLMLEALAGNREEKRQLLKEEKQISQAVFSYSMLTIWCLTAIFGKGYSLRSGVEYNNVLETGGIMKYGPAIGTLSNYMGAYVYNCDYEDWQSYVQDGDRVLIMVDQVMNLGTTQYLFKDVEISHYSVVNPTAYDERLKEYWEMFPEKAPNVIIVDCWYGQLMTNPENWMMQYIEHEFGYTQVNDGRYIRIYRKS